MLGKICNVDFCYNGAQNIRWCTKIFFGAEKYFEQDQCRVHENLGIQNVTQDW